MDKGFSPEWINELKTRNNIVSVISKYTTLQRKGKTHWACCPFHFEKTPSFAINEYEGYYHCFGCGASGDVIKFVEKIEAIDFFDACKRLAENSGMELPEFSNSDNIAKQKKQKDVYLKILRDTAKYYYLNLNSDKAEPAKEYLIKRHLDNSTIKSFGIGYSFGWDELPSYLKKIGYSEDDMLGAGVVDKKNGKIYDALAKRLVFPIINSYGDVVGFSARVLEKTEFAKYKNTAQSLVFDKSKCVYNINHLKEQKQAGTLNEVIIVEGQMDVISLYRNGVKNAVACMGTALTMYHAKEIKRFVDRVVVCFDGDGAGKKATLRSIEILVSAGLNVFVTTLPNGMDPDEYVISNGKENFDREIANASYWVDFLIDDFASKYNLSKSEQKTKFIKDALNVIKTLGTQSEQDIYLSKVKEISNVSVSVLKSDMENLSDDKVVIDEPENKIEENTKENASVKAVKFVIAALLHKKPYAYLDNKILDNLLNSSYVMIYNYIKTESENNKTHTIGAIFDMFDVENEADVYDIVNFEFTSLNDSAEYYKDCVENIVGGGLEQQLKELTKNYTNETDLDKRKEISLEIQKILIKLKGNND